MPQGPRILTLTSDFGLVGPYVAAMKGVVLGQVPDATLVDISHQIGPQNIVEGAFVLSGVVDVFPAGTIHLAVVDPAVGTPRRLVAAKMANQWFLAPDNGLLSNVARLHPPQVIHEIDNAELRRHPVSNTFHGRDILAPAAAHLLLGRPPEQLGPQRHGLLLLTALEPRRDEGDILGEVVLRDSFGNLITNVPGTWLDDHPADRWDVEIVGHRVSGLSRTYAENDPGNLVALSGSQGYIEVSMVNGDASRYLDAGPGTTVWFRRR